MYTFFLFIYNFTDLPLRTATVRIDPDGCSLPFQYSNKEFNKCINVTGMATPQCVTPSGTLTTCIAPPGRCNLSPRWLKNALIGYFYYDLSAFRIFVTIYRELC